MGVHIQIDHRERNTGILELLRDKNVVVEEGNLIIGDYIINGHITVERKTAKDFILSIIDGRLFSQALRLKKYTETHLIVVEGTDLFRTGYDIHPEAIKGAIVSLSVSWQIPLIFSKSTNGTAEILHIASLQDAKYHDELLKRMGRKPKRIQTRRLHILQGLPGIGPKIAKKMLEHFGSIETVITASEEALANVEGIGKKKAVKIREIVSR